MDTLQIWGTTYKVPTTWNELTRAQLLHLVRVLYGPEGKLPRPLQLLHVLSGAPLATLLQLPAVQCVQLYSVTDFVFDEQQLFTQQLLPVVRVGVTRYAGPKSSLGNVLFGEFIFADTYFRAWATCQSAEALHLFLAALYRPVVPGLGPSDPRWQGDQREAFNEHRLEYFAEKLQRLPDDQKLAITTWYRGCRAQLELEFPEVFDVQQQEVGAQQDGDWGRVLRKLSGGAFGTLEQTARQHLRTLMAEMQDAARDYKKQLKDAKR
ncbi:hypothetical protein [Hymenobacter chitinivorans]|uniref:Uncharacterized protein n=1 Tax=Hymenobacter chitinivorans DSM 11115 TaxID=1121954 RepID=A0A2M9BND2_9BACT|nr:hypothetical protein [Hymenobacter chitinivorans]PJJ59446.1 hypothetical protein CLV45_0863 [Hymenobacter chitinivorans DSM 11115]